MQNTARADAPLPSRPAESTQANGAEDHASSSPLRSSAVHSSTQHPSSAHSEAEITPEIVTVIEVAASAYVGRKVHVVSVRVADDDAQPPHSSWTSHGLSLVHGSHNLVQRGH
jgi:hypothetical protein